ncbi:uncharacterized protein LY79DRAFT_665141 [Colletotrichum navitas]|uniref:Uncharacterized protein n=1 Tax=Colletotrichum navitas TaxID=681940 RepID=A0AAD8QBQ8_9PEZI|nr:uncharacterized protein LY79DRAFT_665141 [Colletotrichum navitas]KAK1599470.1 hypothetical protein LY79DRAFT_665141 [Colletotrichum navitas]
MSLLAGLPMTGYTYIKGVGRLLDALNLPDVASTAAEPPLVDALVNVRREEKFFVDTAASFGIEVNLPASRAGVVEQDEKLNGLKRERLARDGLDASADGSRDVDGGALRKEFIPSWSSDEFRVFVDELGAIIDQGYEEAEKKGEEGVESYLQGARWGFGRSSCLLRKRSGLLRTE